MTANLSAVVASFTTSVAVGKDVVPRMSVVNIGRLLDQIVRPPLCIPHHSHVLHHVCWGALQVRGLLFAASLSEKGETWS